MTPTSPFTPSESNGLLYKPHPRFLAQNLGCLQNEDRKTKTLIFYARQGMDGQKTKPKRSSAQTDAKITGSSFCRKDPLNLQNEDPC